MGQWLVAGLMVFLQRATTLPTFPASKFLADNRRGERSVNTVGMLKKHRVRGSLKTVLASIALAGAAYGQTSPAEPASASPASALTTLATSSPDSATGSSATASPESARSNASTMEPTTIEPGTIEPSSNNPHEGDADTELNPVTLLPDLAPLPRHKTSVIGGTITKLDRVRDDFTVRVFGGGNMKIYFDPRTHFYNEGDEASVSNLRPGDRVSIDTMLDGNTIFARNVRMQKAAAGQSQGVVLSYRPDKGELTIRDALSPQPLTLHLTSKTRLLNGTRVAASGELARGTLVNVQFASQRDGHATAEEISVLAVPGTNFTFAGRVTALDLSSGLLVLTASTDGKTYDLYLDPKTTNSNAHVRPGVHITVVTRFDGDRYVAESLTVQ